ncbi:unnamed protein product, partial [Prorocentrum cordatum]
APDWATSDHPGAASMAVTIKYVTTEVNNSTKCGIFFMEVGIYDAGVTTSMPTSSSQHDIASKRAQVPAKVHAQVYEDHNDEGQTNIKIGDVNDAAKHFIQRHAQRLLRFHK